MSFHFGLLTGLLLAAAPQPEKAETPPPQQPAPQTEKADTPQSEKSSDQPEKAETPDPQKPTPQPEKADTPPPKKPALQLEKPAPDKPCTVKQFPQPSRQLRLHRDRYVGFTFHVPINYPAAKISNGTMIMSPASYSEYRCITKNKISTDLPLVSITTKVDPMQTRSAVLYDNVIKAMPWLKEKGQDFTEINFVDRTSLTYRQKNLVHGGMTRYVSFFSNDRTKLITIYGPEGDVEFTRALKTLRMK